MTCHICGDEAVDRCYTCGNLFCAKHGNVDCVRCETAVAPGDPRQDRFSTKRLSPRSKAAWWRPQEAEDYEPPACYHCQGLSRNVCRNCDRRYCGEHAGPSGLCRECGNSSRLGFICMIFGLAVMFALSLWGALRMEP